MRTLALLLCAASLCSCGMIYTNIQVPRAYRSASPSELKTAADDPVLSGEACNQTLLYVAAWGDGGYHGAVRDALRSHPDRVLYDVKTDVKATSVLVGLYTRVCTKVLGKGGRV